MVKLHSLTFTRVPDAKKHPSLKATVEKTEPATSTVEVEAVLRPCSATKSPETGRPWRGSDSASNSKPLAHKGAGDGAEISSCNLRTMVVLEGDDGSLRSSPFEFNGINYDEGRSYLRWDAPLSAPPLSPGFPPRRA